MKQISLGRHSAQVGMIAVSLTALSIMFLDHEIAIFLGQQRFDWFRSLCDKVTDLAIAGPYFAISAAGFVFTKWVLPRFDFLARYRALLMSARRFFALAFLSLTLVGLTLLLTKAIFGRKRPNLTEAFDPLVFDPFNLHWDWHSFPSGHSQVSFVLATLVGSLLPRFSYVIFGLALAMALTRVAIHQHFLSDVIAGAALGYLGTLWVREYFRKFEHRI